MTPRAGTDASSAAPIVNASRFRAAHEADWQRLELLLTRMEKRSVRALDDDDILALPLLYRATLSSLSVARETSLDRALVTYLEQLCTRAYFQLYGVPTSLIGSAAMLQTHAFSRATGIVGVIYGALNLVPSSAGALGLVLAVGGVQLLVSLAERYSPRASEIQLDGMVLAFTLLVSLGVVPLAIATTSPWGGSVGPSSGGAKP